MRGKDERNVFLEHPQAVSMVLSTTRAQRGLLTSHGRGPNELFAGKANVS